jgi:hypothetical protein
MGDWWHETKELFDPHELAAESGVKRDHQNIGGWRKQRHEICFVSKGHMVDRITTLSPFNAGA